MAYSGTVGVSHNNHARRWHALDRHFLSSQRKIKDLAKVNLTELVKDGQAYIDLLIDGTPLETITLTNGVENDLTDLGIPVITSWLTGRLPLTGIIWIGNTLILLIPATYGTGGICLFEDSWILASAVRSTADGILSILRMFKGPGSNM